MNVERMSLGQLGTNGYIIYQENSALIIDPGADEERIKYFVEQHQLNPKAILLTHAHFDHIGAVDAIRDKYNIPVYLHEDESDWLEDPKLNSSVLFPLGDITARRADYGLSEGIMEIDGFKFEVRHTPGHSPGGVIFVFDEEDFVIAGDSLFNGGIGRTDLPGGDYQVLQSSIKNQLYTLPDHFQVLPGHGDVTTIEKEKRSNPFVRSDD
ncbi:Glyoxylase, beta-lactamase superfamily II [Pelagirhabdus alkalitolerans]|uniref:Glyoxylase, beta-lactamase superfamily II n=1 Tax=Pelagirhabdus alkalitolerans TaxID=1612202 RepID=A0A1G6HYU7_9BACI|nr:MBL fold metallo-hydrolase [Pelagirhabdus alkalitolerans]SDB99313.1 Glyoxylase, beta-lactamase superfamily II [Pelagirhabdus alkalitolerans]